MKKTHGKAPAFVSRRGLVVGAAVGAACRPFLRPLRALAAGNPAGVKRVLFTYRPFGVNEPTWFPAQEGPFTGPASLLPGLAPLGPYFDRVLLVDGVDLKTCMTPGAAGSGEPLNIPAHSVEVLHLWTGMRAQTARSGASFGESGFGTWGWSAGQSIDQHLAALPSVRGTAPLASLELGVLAEFHNQVYKTRMSFKAPGQPLTPRSDPFKVFDSVFGSVMAAGTMPSGASKMAATAAAERARLLRTSILSQVRSELGTLRGKLAAADRPTLEAHVSAVESLEKGLAQREAAQAAAASGAGCRRPSLGTQVDPRSKLNFPAIVQQQLRILAAAFACDLTRVASLVMLPPYVTADGVDPGRNYHDTAHLHGGQGLRPYLTRADQYFSAQFAFFLDRLKELDPTGALGLLDSVMIVSGNEHHNGLHNRRRIPFLVINGLGHFKTGRSVKYQSLPHNNLLVSIANAMGSSISTFGDPAFCTGPLPSG